VIRIALDAMGGDHAPQAEVEGAVQALTELPPGFLIQLVGRRDAIEAELRRFPSALALRMNSCPVTAALSDENVR